MNTREISTPSKRLSRNRLVLDRWASVIGDSVVSSAAFVLLAHWRRNDIRLLFEGPSWVFGATFVCFLSWAFWNGRGRWGAFTGLRHFGSYPPSWFAGLVGAALVLVLLKYVPDVRGSLLLRDDVVGALFESGRAILWGVAIIGAVSVARARSHASVGRQSESQEPPHEWTIGLRSFEEISAWVTDDTPVVRTADDAFGHARIAARIASRLATPKPPAQAVVGKLGAGKTTLRHLVVEALGSVPHGDHVRLVPVELWPYETPRAAVAGVIGSLVEALAREVSVLSLRGVPSSYAEAMSAAGGIWSALVRLQRIPSDPFDSLKAIDRVATTIGLQYVVWIEDLERFAGGEPDKPDEERLSPIRALLYGLDQLDSVTVITATTTLHARFDIEKIARFVERIPELPEGRLRKLFGVFRNGLAGGGIVDPASPATRKKLGDLAEDVDMKMVRSLIGPGVHNIADALPALCSTPRVLKKALRSCLDTWARLAGEIDVDDVLVLSVLREAQPDAFALIDDHIHYLRGRSERDAERKAETAWKEALSALKVDERTRTAIKYVIEFAFEEDGAYRKPQGVWHQGHADYWERFLAVPRLAEGERDQPVLKRILAKGDAADADLLDLLEDEDRSSTVEQFRRLLETSRLERLLVPLVERRSRERAGEWPDEDPPGFIPLWRLWNRRAEQGELSAEKVWSEVKRAIDLAVPSNLGLAAALENHFAAASNGVPDLLRSGERSYRSEAKQHLRALLVATYVGREVDLARSLNGARGPVLSWLTWGLDRMRARDTGGLPFEEWKSFAETILKAVPVNRRAMLPQVAGLVTEPAVASVDDPGGRYGFSEERAARLFGDARAVRDLFVGEMASDWSDPNVVAVIAARGTESGPAS